jgi:hypothetical protein
VVAAAGPRKHNKPATSNDNRNFCTTNTSRKSPDLTRDERGKSGSPSGA